MVRGQVQDRREPGRGRGLGDRAARELRVLVKGTLDVHGKGLGQSVLQDGGQHIGLHAVGVHLDRQTQALEVGQKRQQVRVRGGLAARDHDSVQPARARGEKAQYVRGEQHGIALGVPGQAGIMAGGAMQTAAAQKQDTRRTARPVAKAQGGQAAQVRPGAFIVLHDAIRRRKAARLHRHPRAGMAQGWSRAGLLARPQPAAFPESGSSGD